MDMHEGWAMRQASTTREMSIFISPSRMPEYAATGANARGIGMASTKDGEVLLPPKARLKHLQRLQRLLSTVAMRILSGWRRLPRSAGPLPLNSSSVSTSHEGEEGRLR